MSEAVQEKLQESREQIYSGIIPILKSADSPGSDSATPSPNSNPLANIEGLDRAGCIMEWKHKIGEDVPKHLSATFMRKALAYEHQCTQYGGLSSSAKRTLAAVASGKLIEDATRPSIKPGTHLVREWNDRTYQVEVLSDGFLLDGRKYRSLSAIAKKITGAHWSGPRFFGLNDRRN